MADSFSITHYAFLLFLSMTLIGLQACKNEEPMGNMSAGLERALPDRGAPGDIRDEVGSDPLFNNPLVVARLASVRDGATGKKGPLGPFKYTARTRYQLESQTQQTVARIEEKVRFDSAVDGDFSMKLTRDVLGEKGDSTRITREGIFHRGGFYTADSSGLFFLRDSMREDHLQWMRQAGEPLSVLTTLLQTSLRRSPEGNTTFGGRSAEKISLSLIPQRRRDASEEDLKLLRRNVGSWDDWWRHTHEPFELKGTVVLEPGSGLLVSADIKAAFYVKKEGRVQTLRMEHEMQLRPLSSSPDIRKPANTRQPERDRVYRMLRDVVGPSLRL